MNIVKATQQHLVTLMSWFHRDEDVVSWGGPSFTIPFTTDSFINDLNVDELASYVLIADDKEMLGFGQYYARLDKCHLGRLVIAPERRGDGLASVLVSGLIELGRRELDTHSSSLFVYNNNAAAVRAYQKLGFEFAIYPDEMNIDDMSYMVRPSN
jgi:ribosomal protein S18 acetylase RimI-like enzyme